jgi:hypothetical protein
MIASEAFAVAQAMVAPTPTDDLRGYPLSEFVTDEQLSVVFVLHKSIILLARTWNEMFNLQTNVTQNVRSTRGEIIINCEIIAARPLRVANRAETFDISGKKMMLIIKSETRRKEANAETYILLPLNAAHTTIVSTSQFS